MVKRVTEKSRHFLDFSTMKASRKALVYVYIYVYECVLEDGNEQG